MFQSSLAPKGESYYESCLIVPKQRSFNPLSPRRARATVGQANTLAEAREFQSSLAPKGESYRRVDEADADLLERFNPLSPRRARATQPKGHIVLSELVSILSRPEGRELPYSLSFR